MIYRVLARTIAALHVGFVLFVVLGSLLVLRWPMLIWVHLLAVLWAAATMTMDLGCVLTPWEKALWLSGGREPYSEGFLQHHLLRARMTSERSRQVHIALGVGVLLLNVAVYFVVATSMTGALR